MSRRSIATSPGSASTSTRLTASRRGSIATRRRFERLVADGRVYPAYETAQELELKRKVLLGRGKPPVYDRAALELGDEDARRARGGGPAAALAVQARP